MNIAQGVVAVLALVVAAGIVSILWNRRLPPQAGREGAIPIGILGDSDSHSYHDSLSFPAGTPLRGGPYREHTFQWPEVLDQLRGHQVTPGPWGISGTRWSIARLRNLAGLPFRTPRREEFAYNFAWSGSGCAALNDNPQRQVQALLSVMDKQPAHWRRGAVVIRIGVNDFGQVPGLDRMAAGGDGATIRAEIDRCVGHIATATRLIRARHPETAIVLVGIFDNTNWPKYFDRWQSTVEQQNIRRGLDGFDSALRELAARTPRTAFFDDRAWFAKRWGTRSSSGIPDYRPVSLGKTIAVRNSVGDSPDNTILRDGHAGLVWNVLWCQALIALLDERFGMAISPLDDDEVEHWVGGQLVPALP